MYIIKLLIISDIKFLLLWAVAKSIFFISFFAVLNVFKTFINLNGENNILIYNAGTIKGSWYFSMILSLFYLSFCKFCIYSSSLFKYWAFLSQFKCSVPLFIDSYINYLDLWIKPINLL